MTRTVVFILLFLTSCGHNPLSKQIAQPKYYTDNELPLQPKRLWRVLVRWEPYLLDEDKALIVKEFQLVVKDSDERSRLEAEIAHKGGDEAYLRWFEANVFPIGVWERREQARVTRQKDNLTIVLTTKAFKEVPKSGFLNIEPVHFPDPLLEALDRHCQPGNWDVLEKGDSAGVEIVLESRSQQPRAQRWDRVEKDLPNFSWRVWSVAQENRMSYRTTVFIKKSIARCPLPPKVHAEFMRLARLQETGVAW